MNPEEEILAVVRSLVERAERAEARVAELESKELSEVGFTAIDNTGGDVEYAEVCRRCGKRYDRPFGGSPNADDPGWADALCGDCADAGTDAAPPSPNIRKRTT